MSRQILNQTSSKSEFLGRWVFLGTDGWGKKGYPVESFGRAAINAITIAPKLYPVMGESFVLIYKRSHWWIFSQTLMIISRIWFHRKTRAIPGFSSIGKKPTSVNSNRHRRRSSIRIIRACVQVSRSRRSSSRIGMSRNNFGKNTGNRRFNHPLFLSKNRWLWCMRKVSSLVD